MHHALTEFLKQPSTKGNGLTIPVQKSESRSFYSVTVSDIEISPNCNSRAVFFVFFYFKFATKKPKHFGPFADEFWESSNLEIFTRMKREIWPIHKY